MIEFFESHQSQITYSAIVLFFLGIINLIVVVVIRRIGKRTGINEARIKLIARYVNVTLIFTAIIILCFIYGAKWDDIGVVFSSVFAVIGIALFASWSILSNVTSGVVMFFSFPHKIGDKIHIHDKDYEVIGIIEDIRSFHVYIRNDKNELITYPNNLILQKAVSLVQKDAIDE